MARIIDTARKNMIGTNLKRLRTEQSLSQQALSARLELQGVYVCVADPFRE